MIKSITKRFSFNLFSTLVGVFVRLITNSLLPKALGPYTYGIYGFVISIYESIVYFFRTGVINAYYNYNSKYENSYYMNKWFIIYSVLVTTIILTFTIITINYKHDLIWNNVQFTTILIVFSLVIFNEIHSVLNNYGHSKLLTIPVQKIKVIALLIQLTVIGFLYYSSNLNIYTFCTTVITLHLLFSLIVLKLYRKEKVIGQRPSIIDKTPYSNIIKYIYKFSHPLIVLASLTASIMFFDRWYLQKMAGSIDQAFYHFANRLSVLILVFNGAIIPIMQKELVQLESTGNLNLLREKYEQFLLIFFFITNFLVVCVLFNISTIINVLLNAKYESAYFIIMIVVFGTIFRSVGQFQSILLISINKTKTIRNIGVIVAILGMFLTIFFLTPSNLFFNYGLNLGAYGLALKFICLEIISSILIYHIIKKYLGRSKRFTYELIRIPIFLFVLMSLITYSNSITFNHIALIPPLLISFLNVFIFILITLYSLIKYPGIIGLRKDEIGLIYKQYIAQSR